MRGVSANSYSKKQTILQKIFSFSFHHRSLLTLLLLFTSLICAGEALSQAEPVPSDIRHLNTINVFPTSAKSDMWGNGNASLVQDVGGDGIYQNFNTVNSSYLPYTKSVEQSVASPISSETSPDQSIGGSGTSTPSDTLSTTTNGVSMPPDAPLETPPTDVHEVPVTRGVLGDGVPSASSLQQPAPSDVSPNVIPAEVIPTSSDAPTATPSPVSARSMLEQLSLGVYGFFGLVHVTQTLADETITNSSSTLLSSLISHTVTEPQIPSSSVSETVQDTSSTATPELPIDASNGSGDRNTPTETLPPVDMARGTTPSSEESTSTAIVSSKGGDPTLEYTDFAIPPLASGQFITNTQLRLSLGGQLKKNNASTTAVLDVEYLFQGAWQNAGSIVLTDEVSNALNGGYYLFALPTIDTVSDLSHLKVRLVYRGDTTELSGMYIDALWLQVETETFNPESFKARLDWSLANEFRRPQIFDFITTQFDFDRSEHPTFSFRYKSQRNFVVKFVRSLFGLNLVDVKKAVVTHKDAGELNITPEVNVTSDGLITVQLSDAEKSKLPPGEYTINVSVDEGGVTYTDSFSFQWGMIAINANHTEYQSGDTANISLGAVSLGGNTLCDADLELYIIDPTQFISHLPISKSGICNGNTRVDTPDYTAHMTTTVPGTYEMYVEHVDASGAVIAHTSDTFIVQPKHDLWITRDGPTRINPRFSYPMDITVTTQKAFRGTLTEHVPADFTISSTTGSVSTANGEQLITWHLDLSASSSQTYSYAFDAPDVSPYLFNLGPAELVDAGNSVVVRERIPNTVPVLASETITASGNGSSTTVSKSEVTETALPTETVGAVSNVSSVSSIEPTPAILQSVIPQANLDADVNTLSSHGLSATDSTTPTVATSSTVVQDSSTEGNTTISTPPETTATIDTTSNGSVSGALVTPQSAATTSIQTSATTMNGFVEHRRWQIASDATGSMIVFWTDGASIPAGWTCISCVSTSTFYRRFPVGGATYGTTGGAATDTPNAMGAVNASGAAGVSEASGGAAVSISSHSHTITPVIGPASTLPAYQQLRVIQYNSAGTPASVPAGVILVFDTTLPSGWARYTPLDNRYPYGENAIVSGGSNTGTHTITGTTTAAAGTTYRSRTGGTQVTAASATHVHAISTTTPPVNHEPPYIQVIFATSSSATATPTNAIAMWSDTPPAGWLDRSANQGDPFNSNYIKGGSTYGSTGGSGTHTEADMLGIVTSGAIGTINARSGSAGASGSHTHTVDVTNFSVSSNTPPYVSVIFAKYFGTVPIYDQSAYLWYTNADLLNPTDPWPAGTSDVVKNQPIDATLIPLKNGDVIRLRLQLGVQNSTTTGEAFKLQYGTTSVDCTRVPSWADVGASTSSAPWIGYNNPSVSDGATLTTSTITGTNILESYNETDPTIALPNVIGIGQYGEWDYVLKQNNATAGTNYCFRAVKSDGSALFSYTNYPELVTNQAPNQPTLKQPFDNQKIASTSPKFDFYGTDNESDTLSYQIQISSDATFVSVNEDKNSTANGSQFSNIVTTSDKNPYIAGDVIRFTPSSTFTNGTTYYWRVRANDPNGSNSTGIWSVIHSFTIDSVVTVSTWFQTMTPQFNTDTHQGTVAVSGDLVQLASGSTTGTTTSSEIDFSNGTLGNAWSSFSWNDTETSSNITYHVLYYDTTNAVWSRIPDSDLPGNSAGFGTSPVSLLSLDVASYPSLKIEAVLRNLGSSPSLLDWTISWGYRIDTPVNTSPFPNEKIATTTPTFIFSTTDPQGDALVYEMQWSTTSAFTSSTTRTSASSTGFANITNSGNTSPFNSGDTIGFTVQPADTLVNGQTYWWRVRARDPLGANQWSFYTGPQSFTIDTSVTVSTWFQTTGEQFVTDTLSGITTAGTTSATVATTSVETLLGYAEGVVVNPKYRLWNGSSWGVQQDALSVGAPMTWVVTRAAPSSNEYILATMGTNAAVKAQVYSKGGWGKLQTITATIASTTMRGFDVAYEQSSGRGMVVACDGDLDPTYYIWDATSTTWTMGNVGFTTGNSCGWVKLISKPNSNEIVVVIRDTTGTGYQARVWNGSSWGNTAAAWGSMSSARVINEGIAASYENSGNQAIVAVSNGTNNNFSWRAWNGTAWTAAATVALTNDFAAGSLAPDTGTDNMALCSVNQSANLSVTQWTGAAWVASVVLGNSFASGGSVTNDRPIECAFETNGARAGYIMAVYSTSTAIAYQYWNGATWSTAARVSTLNVAPRVALRRTNDGLIQAITYASTTNSYQYSYWNGTTWSALQTLETTGTTNAVPFKEPFMIAPKNSVTRGTLLGSPAIDFYAGSGPYWKQMSWTDTQTGGSSIKYQVQYLDATSNTWTLVPDALIPNNSIGTTTGTINLSGVLPVSTYRYLRPVANMTCNVGTCPVLADWTITWSSGITLSGTAQQFDEATNVTSGTVGVAVNGVLQAGKTGAIAGGTWSIANVNASAGDIVTVFVTGATSSNKAVAVSRYDGVGDMSGLKLYEQHLYLGSNIATSTPFTNTDIGLYDYSKNTDVFFKVSTSSLTMCADTGCANSILYVNASSTYTPNGTVILNSLKNYGTFNMGGNNIYVGRSWLNAATITSGTSTVTFTATSTTESIDETGAISPSFYNLTFGTTTGAGVWNLVTPLTVNGNLSVTRGTLNRGTTAIAVAGALTTGANGFWNGIGTTTLNGSVTTNWSDANVTLQNVGRVLIDGTTKHVTLSGPVEAQSITIGNDDIFDLSASSYSVTVLGDWINNHTFVPQAGTVYFAATTTNHIISTNSTAFYNLNFIGAGGSWSFTEPNVSISHTFTIATGTVTLPTGTTTISGSFTNSGGTFAHNNATVVMNASTAQTITANGTAFTNAFYNLYFNGSGSWSFIDTDATTSNNFIITQGSVTLPGGQLAVGGAFSNTAGTFAHNNGTVAFTGVATSTISSVSSFYSLLFNAPGRFSFLDATDTVAGNVRIESGTTTFPSAALFVGGSFLNTAVFAHNNGTVVFNATTTGKTISSGASPFSSVLMTSALGGWTISTSATTSSAFTIAAANSFTVASGTTLSVGGVFTNTIGGASTTWSGSTLSLESGTYAINSKVNTGDLYGTFRVKSNMGISMWNSSASVYTIATTSYLYSENHGSANGVLDIFGAYTRTSGTDYWSYATDFDGTALIGSPRAVTVEFASGSSAFFGTSTLQIIGTSTATTSITNQGVGTYSITVANGTTTMNWYAFTNLAANGVSLTGSTTVSSLSYGAFTPMVATSAALSVSSTTINQNPALQVFNVNFSTTTAIFAYNVAQTDGTPNSYWWFRSATGTIAGEAHDNDTGDPGSIRWDDSSLLITVAGTIYDTDEVTPLSGPTCNGTSTPVRIVVGNNGSTTYNGSCDGSGHYSISNVAVVGDQTMTVFLNAPLGGERAVTVTKTPTKNIANLNLIAGRVIVRHEDVTPISISDLANYDSTKNSYIPFTAATGTPNVLTVAADTELHVWASSTFTPGGTVTLKSGGTGHTYDGSLHLGATSTFTGVGTTTYAVGGSFTLDSGSIFIPASSTVLMTATTTGKTITATASSTINLNALSFTGAGGGWNINGNLSITSDINLATGTVTGTGNITLLNGSFYGDGLLSLGGGTTLIAQSNTLGGIQGWTFNNLTLGNGTYVGTTTPVTNATTSILGTLAIATGHYLKAGGSVLDLEGGGTVFTTAGTFLYGTSTVRYSGTVGSSILSTNYYNLVLNALGGSPTYTGTGLGIVVWNNMIVGGLSTTTADFNANDPALNVHGNLSIGSNATLVGSNSGSFLVEGNWTNTGTYTSSGGNITFGGAGSATIAAGSSAFSTVVVNGSGTRSLTENATATQAFTLTGTGGFTLQSGTTLAVGGTFANNVSGALTTWTGSTLYLYGGGNYAINASTTNDQYSTLSIAPATQIRMWNSSASTPLVDSTGSLYSMDNANVNGALYIYGAYTKTSGTDYWDYATDFDGTALGGSSRAVSVNMATGTTALYTGGALHVLGTGTATTTIDNQGSGTYSLHIGGTASTSMSYYALQHFDTNGLTFSGTPSVQTLSHGSFTVDIASGTALTVGGTVITQNPAKTFTNNYFSTTTGVSAWNVTATGTTVSSWRFTNHFGAIAGETFDVDPGGDPGYIVWDNSAANITISGNVYSDEGTTVSGACDGTTNDIYLRVEGLTTYSTSCNASTGAYSISGVSYSPGDSLIVYIHGVSQKAATVTKEPVTSVALDLYEKRVIVRHESTNSMTISDMALWSSLNDSDVPFTAIIGSPNTLVLPADRKLIVWTGKTFTPGGNVTVTGGGSGAAYDGTLEMQSGASFKATGSELHTIGGSFVSDSGATFDAQSSTFTFTSSSTSRPIGTNNNSFYNLTMNGSGSWSIIDLILTVNGDLTITSGALTLPTGTTTIAGSLLNNGGSFAQNGGQMRFTASGAKNLRTNGSSFGTTTFAGSGSWTYLDTNATTTGDFFINSGTLTAASGTLTIGGSFVNAGTFTHNSGTLRFTSAKASTTITAGGSNLASTTFAGLGSFIFTDTNVALDGSLTILQGSTTLATGTMAIGGSFVNTGGAFTHATGTLLFNSSVTGQSINPGGYSFNVISIAAPTGGYTITGDATTTSNFGLTSAAAFTLQSGKTLTVNGIFTNLVGGAATTWTGSTLRINSGVSYTVNTSAAGGDVYNLLTISSSTALRMWNSSATTTIADSQSSLYSMNNSGVSGELYIYGNYLRTTGYDYWDYASEFDGTALGGSARAVNVRIAGGATTTFSGGTLEMLGGSGATTTVTNQGTGTYSMNVTGGTVNALNYAFRNTNAYGLNLSGTTVVTSLSNGDFELAVSGGSLITLSSTTLNYNAGSLFTGNRFATTTAITGANVYLVGTTSSMWTFTGYRGNLTGEAFDSDGATNCGSIIWDDSSCLVTREAGYRWRSDNGGEGVPDSEWFNTSWSNRKRVTIANSDPTTYTNAVVKVTVPYTSAMQSNFSDVRFTDSSGTTSLNFTRETYTASTQATFWVKVPTLTAGANTSVYLYYGNGGATYAGSGTTTFPMYEDFEQNNLSAYSGDTSLFTTSGSFAEQESYGVNAVNPTDRTTNGIYRTSATTSQGNTIRFFEYVDTGSGSSDETCTLFGVQSPGTAHNNYAVCLEQFGTDRVSISKNVYDNDTDGTVLASTTITYTTGWYEVEARWGTDNSIQVDVYRSGLLVATTSVTDSTYTSGGMGFTYWFQHGGWDFYTARPLLTTEPSVIIGSEQLHGGASWFSALNTKAMGTTIGTVYRPRFTIENTGLSASDQLRLQYAAKGAAPSCEAVSPSSYSTVPPQSSCSGSPICMQSSTQFTNQASTTDVLGGLGTFTAGQILKDPTNTTASITLGSNTFTEVEYAIGLTGSANDSNYCLRVSNASTSLDSYTHIAELQILFPPNITALSLNGGTDISLTPGTTTTIYATGTVSDLNGYTDLNNATATIFRSGVGTSCTPDQNNCYVAGSSSCAYSSCSGTTCSISCSVDIQYFAEPTDIGTYAGETWRAYLSVDDHTALVATATAPSIDLLTLRAISVNNTIDYAPVAVNSDTGSSNATSTVQNIGNDFLDLSIQGNNLTNGGASVIPASQERFATSTFTYSSCVYCTQLATTSLNYNLNLTKPTTTAPAVTKDIFWGIAVPYGVAGTAHYGSNIFYAIPHI